MNVSCWYECSRGRESRAPFTGVIYRCRGCDGLLDVAYDLDSLKKRSAAEWKALFANRVASGEWPYTSGVWSKYEWVCPLVEKENIVSLGEGNTPLLPVTRLGEQFGVADLWIKQSATSHTGSFKDLGMTVLVSAVNQMIKEGRPIRAVACASTGDTSAALAAYCAVAGIPAIVFLPRGKASTAQLALPIAHGALVLALDTDFDGCMRIVQHVTADGSIYLANSMNSLCIEGQKTVAIELVQQLNWSVPDWIIIPSVNLGNVTALGRGFLMMKELDLIDRLPRIACAQAENVNPLYRSYQSWFAHYEPITAEETLASAIQIGNPVSVERAVKILCAFDGVVEQASEEELAHIAPVADRVGFYCCPQTGVALAALSKLRERGQIGSSERVIVISTGHGLKFTGFKVGYHEQILDDAKPRPANAAVELPADPDVVFDWIVETLDKGNNR